MIFTVVWFLLYWIGFELSEFTARSVTSSPTIALDRSATVDVHRFACYWRSSFSVDSIILKRFAAAVCLRSPATTRIHASVKSTKNEKKTELIAAIVQPFSIFLHGTICFFSLCSVLSTSKRFFFTVSTKWCIERIFSCFSRR